MVYSTFKLCWCSCNAWIIIPFLVWPDATGGTLDAPRLLAAIAAFCFGIWKRSALWSVLAGISVLYSTMFILN